LIITTVTSTSHLYLAKAMARSVREQMPNAIIAICLVEEELPSNFNNSDFDHIVLAKNLGFSNFYQSIFKYKTLEAITSVKGQLFLYLLKHFPNENKFIFLDTDIKVYSPFHEVSQILDKHPIILTPHLLKPQNIINNSIHWEQIVSLKGTFNTGFLAIKRSEEAERFIKWWAKRLEYYCLDDQSNGMFVDQKWVDLAPCFFDIYILKHPGYNAAIWNLEQRNITLGPNGEFNVNGEPLRFFHFVDTSEGAGLYQKDSIFMPYWTKEISLLIDKYIYETSCLKEFEYHPWSYDYFFSGEKITDNARNNYKKYYYLFSHLYNPFEYTNKHFK
jgi:hypothetical protein